MTRSKFRSITVGLAGFAACSAFVYAYSAPYFSEILPNTENDAALEYFTLRNPACVPISLSGYSVVDASWKAYAFASWTSLEALSSASFYRPETKIALNNENETLSLFDPFAVSVDFYSYLTSTKGATLVRSGFSDDVCRISSPPDPAFSVPLSETPPPESSPAPQDPDPPRTEDASVPVEEPSVPDASPESVPDSASDVQDADAASQDSVTWIAVTESDAPGSGVAESDSWSDAESVSDPSVSGTPDAAETAPTVSAPAPVVQVTDPSVSRAVAETLELVDANGDGRFDFADVRYSENLSGTADPSEYFLYSNTWGLYAARIATATGFFSTATISWSVLRLWFTGTTLAKTSFRIDSSTASEFRIKNLSTASLKTASSWLPAVPLALTTSFSGYSSDRISFSPAFPEPETDAPSGVSVLPGPTAAAPLATVSDGNSAIPVPTVFSGSSSANVWTGSKAKTSNSLKSAKKIRTISGYSSEPMPEPEGFSIVPSSGIDLMPSWKYRYVCFSSTCPVSFKTEGVPSGSRSYWLFPDGRKRFWTTTSTLWKTVPASYRLAFVIETARWTSRTAIEVSVADGGVVRSGASASSKVRADSKTTASAKKAVKSVASASSESVNKKTAVKTSESRTGAPVSKFSTGASSVVGSANANASDSRTVSVALASVFLWLSIWTWWFALRRRAWLPEETP